MTSLQIIFHNLSSQFSTDERLIGSLWQEIEESYSMPERHYHNLSHLEYMMEKAFEHRDKIVDFEVLLFSIFYHDLVYDPKRKDNEWQSAEIAKNRMYQIGVPEARVEKSYRQILATRHNEQSSDTDTRYLLDMDLAILGEEPVKYADYTQKVRQEYASYPDVLFKKGRIRILQNMLGQERIYQTHTFYGMYEEQARKNILEELKKLKS